MVSKIENNINQILPDHPHRRMHILVSILAFVFVVGIVVLYQMNMVNKVSAPIIDDPSIVTQERIDMALAKLEETINNQPEVSDERYEKALNKLENSIKNQK